MPSMNAIMHIGYHYRMDIDEVYGQIGEFGRYQVKVLWATALIGVLGAFHMVHLVFIGAEPQVREQRVQV